MANVSLATTIARVIEIKWKFIEFIAENTSENSEQVVEKQANENVERRRRRRAHINALDFWRKQQKNETKQHTIKRK